MISLMRSIVCHRASLVAANTVGLRPKSHLRVPDMLDRKNSADGKFIASKLPVCLYIDERFISLPHYL